MAVLRGTPFVKLGATAQDCSSRIGSVPAPCEPCRQTTRWLPRTVSWTTNQYRKFKSILQTILQGHDEILQSLCGFCADQTAQTCECFVAEYVLLGLPVAVEIDQTPTDCACLHEDVVIDVPCAGEGATDCMRYRMVHLCSYCETVTLDACNNPTHLDLMLRAVAASRAGFGKRAAGETVLAVVQALFPDTVPIFRQVKDSVLYVDIGREFTATEVQFLRYLTALIPVGFGVQIKFVTQC